jgi:hypothetical protein
MFLKKRQSPLFARLRAGRGNLAWECVHLQQEVLSLFVVDSSDSHASSSRVASAPQFAHFWNRIFYDLVANAIT